MVYWYPSRRLWEHNWDIRSPEVCALDVTIHVSRSQRITSSIQESWFQDMWWCLGYNLRFSDIIWYHGEFHLFTSRLILQYISWDIPGIWSINTLDLITSERMGKSAKSTVNQPCSTENCQFTRGCHWKWPSRIGWLIH